MVHRDRFERKIAAQDAKLAELKTKAVGLNKQGKREEALFTVKKVQRVKNFKKTLWLKLEFVD